MERLRSEQGTLYVEALVGLTLLAFSLLAISPLFLLSMKGNATSGDMTAAAMLTHDKAEELK
ncbi:hypothetical protein ACFLU6_11575, partial [Acidobacteriota bacterium]